MDVLDKFGVQLIGTYLAQECIINFYYECYVAVMTDPILPSQFGADFYNQIGEVLLDQLSNGVDITLMRMQNYTNENEFFEVAWINSGTRSGDAMPSFVAHGLQLTRGNKNTRNGSRRIPGVMEGDITDGNNPPTPVQNGLMSAFMSDFSYVEGANNFLARPVILGRDQLGRIEPTRYSPVTGVTYKRVTTQNSRKKGRGR